MSTSPEISVIINNYNYGRFLQRAIDSALAQEDVRHEVVVVDDGSTDGSAELIRSYGKRIRPVLKGNGGQASAMNAGAIVARAPLFAFLDSDDWWQPRKLQAVVRAFDRAPGAGLVYHRLQPVYSDGTPASVPIPRSLVAGDLTDRLLKSGGCWPFPMTSSLAVRRTAWEAAGEIPSAFRISADAWLVGVLPFLTQVVALPEALGLYRIHDNSWYRAVDDAATLARRMEHWEQTARVTNRFLAHRRHPGRVSIEDNFAYQVAAARLGLPGSKSAPALALHGLRDRSEPNPLRRARGTLRVLATLRRPAAQAAAVTE